MAKTIAQASQYDKILHENIEAALPGLVEKVLGIHVIRSEALSDSIQHTKERKPEVLKKVTDDWGRTFILQIEFQSSNDRAMAYRMAEYLIMLSRKHKMAVQQYVIYIGEAKMRMTNKLKLKRLTFSYDIIDISNVDYNVFLASKDPEEILFALLGDFGKDGTKRALDNILEAIILNARGALALERFKNQFRILAQLRNLAIDKNVSNMEPVASFFKMEKDIFYRIGEEKGLEKGLEKGKTEVIKNLLSSSGLTIPQIATFSGVSESFVRKVKKGLK